ncbi:MAG: acyl-CoA desaturase [Deltaproteobacteria bacterium]|nr:acyl-CoA desaturase [Deltaproteobacteria bacterium]MBT6488825.1 acyl-CoA desaturase [Deltaproteobacteria bacterium]
MKKPNAETLDLLGKDLDKIRNEAMSKVGQEDADYIRKIVNIQRGCEVGGRVCLMFGLNPIFWTAGVGLLSLSKILDNMEIGHNILHGQYDWMNDPHLNSKTYEWDIVCDSESWARTHNYEHHTYTNILGKDRDYGYGLLRLTHKEKWSPLHLFQFIHYLVLSAVFEWGVALHELRLDEVISGKTKFREKIPFIKSLARKSGRQIFKDYIFFPILAGPALLPVLAGNFAANIIRNLWTSTIIFCGHFPDEVEVFTEEESLNESQGHWYYRQILGSANFDGSDLLHLLSGHLSLQVEHHLFPNVPAHRYKEMAPQVEAVAKKYGIPYNKKPFWTQYKTVVKRILRHSIPEFGKLRPAIKTAV